MKESPFEAPQELLRRSGRGEMRRYRLFPGIELSHNRFFAERISLEHKALEHVMEINHCFKGRIGWDMKGGFSVYLGPGDMDIHTMDWCAVSTMSLPLGYYEGISVLIDLEELEKGSCPLVREAGIAGRELLKKLCPRDRPCSLPGSEEISRIFSVLYGLPERLAVPYYKVKVLELLLFLERLEPEREKRLDQYYSQQVEAVKEIHALLVSDLARRYTIQELSKKYLINTSALKSVFKAVYSQPVGSYMKEYRIRHAMKLLRQSDRSIADIARETGYENQGKFSEAFKSVAHVLPTEYRRQSRRAQGPGEEESGGTGKKKKR